MNVTITPAAEKFIRRMIRFNGGGPDGGFRLVVTPGGCSGLNSDFTVEAAPLPGDGVFDGNGIRLFLPAESAALLAGATIDFADTPMSSGLVFLNTGTSCACSSSAGAPAPGVGSVDIASIGRRH